MSSPAAAAPIIYLGMDVHKDSITIAVLPMAAKNPTRLERLPNDLPKLKRYLDRLARDGALCSRPRDLTRTLTAAQSHQRPCSRGGEALAAVT